MQIIHDFYDVYAREHYNPITGKVVHGFVLPRLDWIRWRIAATYGRVKVPKTGPLIPTSGSVQYPINSYTTGNFTIKSETNWLQGNEDAANSEVDYSVNGFDTADTAWHHLSGNTGLVTLAPIVIPITVLSGPYTLEVSLYTSTVRWSLINQHPRPLDGTVLIDVFTGLESNAPSGTAGSVGDDFTISGTNAYVDVEVEGATASTRLAIGFYAPTGEPGDPGTVIQTPLPGGAADTVRLAVNQAPGTGAAFNGHWSLLNL